eukprot:3638656-Pleurochrysis_carterae.AAC.1
MPNTSIAHRAFTRCVRARAAPHLPLLTCHVFVLLVRARTKKKAGSTLPRMMATPLLFNTRGTNVVSSKRSSITELKS